MPKYHIELVDSFFGMDAISRMAYHLTGWRSNQDGYVN